MGHLNASYCYDLNGDMVTGDGRNVTWSAFGMPVRVEKGLNAIDITYGPDRARFKRVDTNATGTTTTYYAAGGSFEVVVGASGLATQKAYVAGVAVVSKIETAPAPATYTPFLRMILSENRVPLFGIMRPRRRTCTRITSAPSTW